VAEKTLSIWITPRAAESFDQVDHDLESGARTTPIPVDLALLTPPARVLFDRVAGTCPIDPGCAVVVLSHLAAEEVMRYNARVRLGRGHSVDSALGRKVASFAAWEADLAEACAADPARAAQLARPLRHLWQWDCFDGRAPIADFLDQATSRLAAFGRIETAAGAPLALPVARTEIDAACRRMRAVAAGTADATDAADAADAEA
jgi:hypothetical protein